MIAWKQSLKPSQIAQVSSYVLQFQGTTPAEPKVSEGDLWVDENAPEEESAPNDATPDKETDSTSVVINE